MDTRAFIAGYMVKQAGPITIPDLPFEGSEKFKPLASPPPQLSSQQRLSRPPPVPAGPGGRPLRLREVPAAVGQIAGRAIRHGTLPALQTAFPKLYAAGQVVAATGLGIPQTLQNLPPVVPQHPGFNRAIAQAPVWDKRAPELPFPWMSAPRQRVSDPVADTYKGMPRLFNRWYGGRRADIAPRLSTEGEEHFNRRIDENFFGKGTPTATPEQVRRFGEQLTGQPQAIWPVAPQNSAHARTTNITALPKNPSLPLMYHEFTHAADPFSAMSTGSLRSKESELPAMLMENAALQSTNPAFKNHPEAGILNPAAEQMKFTGNTDADVPLLRAYVNSLRSMPDKERYLTPGFYRSYLKAQGRSPYEYTLAGNKPFTPEQAQQQVSRIGPGYKAWLDRSLKPIEKNFTPAEEWQVNVPMAQTPGRQPPSFIPAPPPPPNYADLPQQQQPPEPE